jgi:hypothetical protein
MSVSSFETGEGYVSATESLTLEFADRTPHPALRATLSHIRLRQGFCGREGRRVNEKGAVLPTAPL